MSGFDTRTVCPACGTQHGHSLYKAPYDQPPISTYLEDFYRPFGQIDLAKVEGADYSLIECSNCGLIYQEHIPGDDLMHTLYEEWINPDMVREMEEQEWTLDYYRKDTAELISLIAFFGCRPGDLRFFDFGMGWANWCQTAMGLGVQAFGAELSETRLDHARSVGVGIVTWEEIPGSNFDFISTEQVMEHLAEPYETLEHLSKGLAPGGVLKISVPNGGDIKTRMKKMDWMAPKSSPDTLNAVAPLEHINCFHYDSIVHMAQRAGLKLVTLPDSGLGTPAASSGSSALIKAWVRNNSATLKKLARPVFHRMFAANKSYAKGTRLYFQKPA